MVIGMDLYEEIRQGYIAGESQRSMARRLGVSRQTVKKYCQGATMPGIRKTYQRVPTLVTDEVLQFIQSCLEEDRRQGLSKQFHTAKRIHQRLEAELGFTGSYSLVRQVVHRLRGEFAPPQADIPLEYDPGDAVQIDWGECTIYLDGIPTVTQIFCARLCCSCDMFVMAFHRQNQESFLEAHQKMFAHFGGVPRRVIFDNAKVAVKEGFGLHAKPQEKYRHFAAHYGFKTEFCNIAKGNEKGLVEGLVAYARKNFFVPVPKVASMEVLNQQLKQDCLQYRNTHKIADRQHTVAEQYAAEAHHLLPIPAYRFETARIATPIVGDYSTVRFEGNNYSVPVQFLRKTVAVKGYAERLEIHCDKDHIVEYSRIFGKNQTQYRLEHYLNLLEKKPRSVFQAKPVRQNTSQELLDWGKRLPGGNRDMVKLLRLCVEHGEDKILALKDQLGDAPTLANLRSQLGAAKVISFPAELAVTQTDLSFYDQKCGVSSHE